MGAIEKGNTLSKSFSIKNLGLANLVVSQISIDNNKFSLATPLAFTVNSKSEDIITIVLDGAIPGDHSANVQITHNDNSKSIIEFTINGTINNSTTWDGNTWTNNSPNSSIDVILTADYRTSLNGDINARDLILTDSINLIVDEFDGLVVSGTITQNNGVFTKLCMIDQLNVWGVTATIIDPVILTSILDTGKERKNYRQDFFVDQLTNPIWSVDESTLPEGLTFIENELVGEPIGYLDFLVPITVKEGNCEVTDTFNLWINDLPKPHLYLEKIIPTIYGNDDFYIEPTSLSKGIITYSSAKDGCAIVDTLTGLVQIICGGPISDVEVSVYQERTLTHRADSIIAFKSLLAEPRAEFIQLSGENVAIINRDGSIQLLGEGNFSVSIHIPATNNYAETSKLYEFTIFDGPRPPEVYSDTIVLSIGEDTTINILNNDRGMTGTIIPSFTDIDVVNAGIQNSFYEPSLGSFDISEEGLLYIDLKDAYFGESQIEYRVIDDQEQWSNYGKIILIVEPLEEIPELVHRQLYTPNGDGLNDEFVIGFVNATTPGDLTILDRLGNQIYEQTGYTNDWDFSLANGDLVEDGVYFFIYQEEGRDRLQGTFVIKRQ